MERQVQRYAIVLLMVAVVAAVCATESAPRHPRLRRLQAPQKLRLRQLQRPQRLPARQQQALAAAVTPYPAADELKPAVPFVAEAGPAEQAPFADDGGGSALPSADAPQQFAPNPDAEEFLPAVDEQQQPLRLTAAPRHRPLVQPRRNQRLQTLPKRPTLAERLVVAAAPQPAQPVALALALPPQQFAHYSLVLNQPFAYSAQYQQTW